MDIKQGMFDRGWSSLALTSFDQHFLQGFGKLFDQGRPAPLVALNKQL